MANDEWANIPDAPKQGGDGWDALPDAEAQPAQPEAPFEGSTHRIAAAQPTGYFGGIAAAFKSGAAEGYGDGDYGLSNENRKWILDKTGPALKAFDENVLFPSIEYLDSLWRTPASMLHAVGDAAMAAGMPRDFVSLLEGEAFYGSPHPTGNFKSPGDALTLESKLRVAAGKNPPGDLGSIPIEPPATPLYGKNITITPVPEAERGMPTPHDRVMEAADLGVIGPEKPEPSFDTPPSQMAEEAIPRSLNSAVNPDAVKSAPGHNPGEYDARGKEWIDKIDSSDSARDAIEKIARDNDFFPEARGGVASPAARAAVAEAAGLDASDVKINFDGDGHVRATIQALRQTEKDFADTSAAYVKDPSIENAAAMQEAELRHTHVLEYTMGARAESGRSLLAWKDLLRETERKKASVAIRTGEETGTVPKGTSPVVDAANEVQDNLKAGKKPGIAKLIDAAKGLVDQEKKVGSSHADLDPGLKSLVDEAAGTLKELKSGGEKTPAGFQRLIDTAESLVGAVEKTGEPKTPMAPELKSMVDEASGALKKLKEGEKTPAGFQRLIDAAEKLIGETQRTPEARAPLSPELASMVGEARNVLKRFGTPEDGEALEGFRTQLEALSKGEGKLVDTVEAARALLEKNTKPKTAETPKAENTRGKLMSAAKRLVDAADRKAAVAKEATSSEMQGMMETVRQAVGRLKQSHILSEVENFRDALNSKDPAKAVEAANKLIEADKKPHAAGEAKPSVEHDQVMAAARRVAQSAIEKTAKEKQALPPDLAGLVDDAKEAAGELSTVHKSELEKLIDAAEKQAVDMVKDKAVKEPLEALPPELQALVDKTQRVVSRFGGVAHGEKAALLLARTGRTMAEQEQIARSVVGLNPNQVARVLDKLRNSKMAEQPGWFYWLWQQGLISGLITHTKYLTVNTATIIAERVIAPFISAAIGKARGQDASIMAPIHANLALVHAVPDALAAAGQAFKTGDRVPLASELRLFERGEESPQAKGGGAAYIQGPSPDWGIWRNVFNETKLDTAAKVLGIPGRSANMIHTFYKVLSERAAASTRAYEAAFEEGAKGDKFWQRYQYHLDNPTDDALRGAVNDAYSGAFMSKLGGKTEQWAHTLAKNPITKWLFPFQHIPWNIERMTIEYSPFAVLGPEMRGAILGEKGAPAQNLAIAKMAVGSSVLGYFMHKTLAGEATGDYPTDPTERKRWAQMGIAPNSIKINDSWVSIERLGPIANVAHIGAVLGSIIHNFDSKDDDRYTGALWAASVGAANQIGNEVGFQTLRNLMEAMHDEKAGAKFVANQASSFTPWSSFFGQGASFADPYMRKANDLVSGFKNRVPLLRETLPAKLDPLYGEPVANPGYHSIFRSEHVNDDPVKSEMDRLKIYVTPPGDRVGNVKLTDDQHQRLQMVAGALVKQTLGGLVNGDGWAGNSDFMKEMMIRDTIKTSREMAASAFQAANPKLIQQGVQQKLDHISGKTSTDRPKKAPALADQ